VEGGKAMMTEDEIISILKMTQGFVIITYWLKPAVVDLFVNLQLSSQLIIF